MGALRTLLFALLVSVAGNAASAGALLSDVLYRDGDGAARLDIRLGIPVAVVGEQSHDNGRRVVLRLDPQGAAGAGGWMSTEMHFEEAGKQLRRVALEGSPARGYELALEFSRPVVVQVLPQYDDRQVLVKFAEVKSFKKLSRFRKARDADPYVVNLESRAQSIPSLTDIPERFAAGHSIYVTSFPQDGETWHRLRLGFLPTAGAAQRMANALREQFPDAWIAQVSSQEVSFAESFKLNPEDQVLALTAPARPAEPAAEADEVAISVQVKPVTPSSIDQAPAVPEVASPEWRKRETAAPSDIDLLLEEAREAFVAEDYNRAISLYTKVLGQSDGEQHRQARELLGVAREMNGQLAHAKRIYQELLADPTSDEADLRVRQRLAALVALETVPGERHNTKPRQRKPDLQVAGQFSQFYRRHSLDVDENSSLPIDGLFNDLNLMAAHQGGSIEQQARVSLSYLADFTGRLDGREFQVSHATWEGYSPGLGVGLVAGRQSRTETGVLGRFDGLALFYQPWEQIGVEVTGGYLVDSSFDSPSTDRPFVSVSGEWISASGDITVEPFFVQQWVDDDIVDRRAVGAQAQLHHDLGMFFTLVDYDTYHSVFNNFTFMGDLDVRNSRLFGSYEFRRSPYLTTRNALIGQPFDELSELEQALLDLELEDVAADRTATSQTIRLGFNQELSDNWSVTTDVVVSDYSDTDSSVDVIGLESSQSIYSSVQVRSNDVFGASSYSAVTFRYADSGSSTTNSMFVDNRFGLGKGWRLYPRLRVDYREFDRNGDTQWTARPSMRVDYRRRRGMHFELEAGYEWSRRQMSQRDLDITGVFLRAGYRMLF